MAEQLHSLSKRFGACKPLRLMTIVDRENIQGGNHRNLAFITKVGLAYSGHEKVNYAGTPPACDGGRVGLATRTGAFDSEATAA
jgi:hypothetical protein